jgi:hypothetical protein
MELKNPLSGFGISGRNGFERHEKSRRFYRWTNAHLDKNTGLATWNERLTRLTRACSWAVSKREGVWFAMGKVKTRSYSL